jgi:hypothetical protein
MRQVSSVLLLINSGTSLERRCLLIPNGQFLPASKLVYERYHIRAIESELAFADHVDQLDAGKYRACRPD